MNRPVLGIHLVEMTAGPVRKTLSNTMCRLSGSQLIRPPDTSRAWQVQGRGVPDG